MNMSKSRDIQAKMPSPKVIYASNESKSVLARNLEECRDNDKNSQSVFLSFKCILARNCEGTEQLHCREKKRKKQEIVLQSRHESGYCLLVMSREVFCVSEGHRKPETYRTNLCD